MGNVCLVPKIYCTVFPLCSCFCEGIIQGTFQQLFETLVLMSWNNSNYVGGGSPLSHFSFLLSCPDPRGSKSPIYTPRVCQVRVTPGLVLPFLCSDSSRLPALQQHGLSAGGRGKADLYHNDDIFAPHLTIRLGFCLCLQ